MAVRGTATPHERFASILARANMPTLSEGLLLSEIRTLPSWVARSICGEICRTLPTTSGASSRLMRTVAPGLSLSRWTLGTSASSSISLLTEMRNIGPACGEAGAGRAQRNRPGSAGGRARHLWWCGQPSQFLIVRDRIAFLDEYVGDPGA